MPPQRRNFAGQNWQKRGGKCQTHCVIWWGRNGVVQRGCAHCSYVAGKHYETDEDVLLRAVRGSQDGHAKICGRPIVTSVG